MNSSRSGCQSKLHLYTLWRRKDWQRGRDDEPARILAVEYADRAFGADGAIEVWSKRGELPTPGTMLTRCPDGTLERTKRADTFATVVTLSPAGMRVVFHLSRATPAAYVRLDVSSSGALRWETLANVVVEPVLVQIESDGTMAWEGVTRMTGRPVGPEAAKRHSS